MIFNCGSISWKHVSHSLSRLYRSCRLCSEIYVSHTGQCMSWRPWRLWNLLVLVSNKVMVKIWPKMWQGLNGIKISAYMVAKLPQRRISQDKWRKAKKSNDKSGWDRTGHNKCTAKISLQMAKQVVRTLIPYPRHFKTLGWWHLVPWSQLTGCPHI